MAKLNTYVHAVEVDGKGKPTGRAETFGPDDRLPDWAVQAIENPDVWVGEAPERKPRPAAVTVPAAPPRNSELEQLRARVAELEAAAAAQPEPAKSESKPPPKAGTGSGREAWAAYAAGHAVDVPEGAGRDQIIQLLDDAKVPTE